jgi:hypothetical protein
MVEAMPLAAAFKTSNCTSVEMLRLRLTYAFASQRRFTDAAIGAAGGKLSIDRDRRYSLDPKSLRSLSDCPILHIEHRNLAGVTGDSVYQLDNILTCRAAGAKNFDLPFRAHTSLLSYFRFQ